MGRSRNKLPRAGSEENSDEEAEAAKKRGREEVSRKALKEMPAPFFRYIDRAEGKILAVPSGEPLVQEVWGSNYVDVNQALIQELDVPVKLEALSEKAKVLEERKRKRLAEQGEQWKEDHALEQVWGQKVCTSTGCVCAGPVEEGLGRVQTPTYTRAGGAPEEQEEEQAEEAAEEAQEGEVQAEEVDSK